MNLADLQIELEGQMILSGINRYERQLDRAAQTGAVSESAPFKRMLSQLVNPMAEGIAEYKDYYKGKPGRPSKYLIILNKIDNHLLAYVTLRCAIDATNQEYIQVKRISKTVASRLEDEINFRDFDTKAPAYVAKIQKQLAKNGTASYKHKKQSLMGSMSNIGFKKEVEWSEHDKIHIGNTLINILCTSIYLNDEAVFRMRTAKLPKGVTSVLEFSEDASDWIHEFNGIAKYMTPCYRPCVVPPRYWTNQYNGGYHSAELRSKINLVRAPKWQRKHIDKAKMPIVYNCVNANQSVQWEINEDIYKAMQLIAASGKELALPSKEPIISKSVKHEMPAELSNAIDKAEERFGKLKTSELKDILSTEDWLKFCEWRREVASKWTREKKRTGKFMSFSRTMREAEIYRGKPIHFVYTLDFRGRVYCLSTTISPQGDDCQKALIKCSKQQPALKRWAKWRAKGDAKKIAEIEAQYEGNNVNCKLGDEGRFWLGVHGSGVWGYDKEDFQTRYQFILDMEDDIRDFVEDPSYYTGWVKADKPWQFLAWCYDWVRLLDWEEEGKPTEDYESTIIVAQDGSCSGLQHYSGMLRDEIAGELVNLTPSDKPRDIYGTVAGAVKVALSNPLDFTPDECRYAKQWLDLKFDRGLTKKPVMTLPYGSTRITCMDSIFDWLDDKQDKSDKKARASGKQTESIHDFDDLKEAVKFMTQHTWAALDAKLGRALKAMAFIKYCVRQVAKAGYPVIFPTPLGFPVGLKKVKRGDDKVVQTKFLGKCTSFTISRDLPELDVAKMVAGAAPNTIHSFDATHLDMACDQHCSTGFPIGIIHDSFGTFPGRTPQLRYTLKDTFAALYEDQDWLLEFKLNCEKILGHEIEDAPDLEYGTLTFDQFRAAEYPFS